MKEVKETIDIEAPLAIVWAVLMDYKAYPEWNPTIRHLGTKNKVGKKFKLKLTTPKGRTLKVRPKLLEFKEKDTYRWKGKLLLKAIFTGEHYFEVKANKDGSTTFVQGEIFKGAIVPVMGAIIKDLGQSYVVMNQALKERCEAIAAKQ